MGSQLPAWLQAAAAIFSAFVTWRLVALTANYVRLTADIATTAKDQASKAALAAQNQLKAKASALREDLYRIRTELGPEPTAENPRPFSFDSLIPTIHEWSQGLIPALAELDPEIVRHALILDRQLHNHTMAMKVVAGGQQRVTAAAAELERLEGGEANTPAAFGAVDIVLARRALKQAQDGVRPFLDQAEVTYRLAHDALRTLEQTVSRALVGGAA